MAQITNASNYNLIKDAFQTGTGESLTPVFILLGVIVFVIYAMKHNKKS